MRHGGKVGDDGTAGNVLAKDDGEQAPVPGKAFAGDQFAERDHLAVGVGQFDAHDRAARNGRDAGGNGAHVAGDVVRQANDAAGLDAGGRFQFVHGDHRAGADPGDFALDVEIIEHGFEQAGVAFQPEFVDAGADDDWNLVEKFERGEVVLVEQIALTGEGAGGCRFHRFGGIADFGRLAGVGGDDGGGGERAGLGVARGEVGGGGLAADDAGERGF